MRLFVLYAGKGWVDVLPAAMECFGSVKSFSMTERGFESSSDAAWLAQQKRLGDALLSEFTAANSAHPFDAVVSYVAGLNIHPAVLREMGHLGAAIFNFCWDDKLAFPGRKVGGRYAGPASIASAVDLNITNAPESVVKYAGHGGLALFSPECALPELHRPYDVPFKYDVSFVGSCYGWRPRFIGKLEERGISVTCFGHGWPSGALGDDEMVQLYSESRINLGFAGIGHSRKLMCLKGRDFEVPMSGGLYLTQHNPDLEFVYRLGEEIVTYRDENECARRIQDLLRSPERAAAIRRAGRARCLREHTYQARWSEVFRLAGLLT
jgi:hypothetical protein